MSQLPLRLHRPLTALVLICLLASLFPPAAAAQTTGSITRYEDSAGALSATGTWAQANASDASGGTVRQSNTVNSTLSLTFAGPWVSVGFRSTSGTGIAEVLIDGVSQGTVDTYSRQLGTTTRIYDDLGSGSHTLSVRVTNTKNPLSSATWVALDYIDVWNGDPLPQGSFEQDNARVHRSTNWVNQANATASGGSYLRNGSNAWFSFTGTTVSFDAIAESGGGTIQIFIDGESQGFFSLYSPTLTTRAFSFAGLDDTAHVLQVQAYRDRAIIDAFRAPGSAPFVTAPDRNGVSRYEEDDPALRYDGLAFPVAATKWNQFSNDRISGRYGVYVDALGSTVSLTFSGPWAHVGLLTTTNGGVVEVAIDGVSQGAIDTYSREENVRSVAYGDLGPGEHTLTLTTQARPSGTPGGNRLHLDYIDAWDGTAMADGTFEHDSSRVLRSSDWTIQSNASASGGSYLRDGPNIWVPFTGDSITLQGIADANGGQADLIIDGERRGPISYYHPTTTTRSWTFDDLGPGGHVLQVRAYRGGARFDTVTTPGTGDAHSWPTPTGVVRHEEDHPALRYSDLPLTSTTSAWAVFSNNRLSGRYGVWTGTANITASLTVAGSWLHIGFLGTTNGGQVEVQIDGVSQGIVDTYRASEQTFSVVYPDLGPGEHTVTLALQSTPSGRRLHLDYIDAWDGTAMPAGSFEHDSERMAHSGSWIYVAEAKASGGSYLRSGYSSWFAFTGESVSYQAWSNGGTVELRVDGQVAETVSLQQSVAGLKASTLSDLGAGPHVLEVRGVSGHAGIDHTATPGRAHGAAPSGLRALATTDTAITLAWDAATAAAGIADYDVYVGDVLAGTTAGNSLAINNLLAGTSYALTVRARDTLGTLSPASAPLSVTTSGTDQGVTLVATLSPTSATTDERIVDLVVEARDANGNLVPGYRGAIEIAPSAPTAGLPQNASGADYTFTAGDAGRRVFSDFAFTTGGAHTVTVTDRHTPSLTATTGAVTVQAIRLVVSVSPTIYAGDPTVEVTLEVQDDAGNLVPSYRGGVRFSSTSTFSGLPRTGLGGIAYTFTAADAGRHVWTGVTLNTAGTHTLTAGDGIRSGVSAPFEVQAVSLAISVGPTTVFAGEPSVEVTVEAQDVNGNVVPGYRGTVSFSSTSSFSGLPPGGLGGARYTFTAADAGSHTWTGVTLNTAGSHTISVGDGTRSATSTPITVQAISLVVLVSPTTVFAGEPVAEVTVEARDQNGDLVPGYRGRVGFSSTSAFSGLPTVGLGALGYTFTAADGGSHTWTGVTLNMAGSHTISVGDGFRQATSTPITVQAISLTLLVSSTTVFAGEPALEVTVEARDENGDLVPGYRGAVTFSSTSAFSSLPVGGLGGNPYGFTEADAGSHTWTNVVLNTPGTQTISVSDGFRQATSASVTVQAVTLTVSVSPATLLASDAGATVTVEARDQNGNLVPGYRGRVGFSSMGAFSGLPTVGLGALGYTFTAADGGSHTWTGVSLHTAGTHTISVGDGYRQATSAPVTVEEVTLVVSWSAASAYVDDRALSLTIRAEDAQGQLVPGYRGALDISSSAESVGIPQSEFQATADFSFGTEHGGQVTFDTIALRSEGEHTVTVTDRGEPSRSVTSAPITVTPPPDPTPIAPGESIPPFDVPPSITSTTSFPLGWGMPYVAQSGLSGLNAWRAHPDTPVPASPGTFYVVSGITQRNPGEWWPTTSYTCPYLAWEHTLTSERPSGGGVDGGPAANDPTALGFGLSACGGGSGSANDGAAVPFGPALTEEEFGAPAGTQGTHLSLHMAGNTVGRATYVAAPAVCLQCEAMAAGDPVDTRSGFFYLNERDLSVATGSSVLALSFERSYNLTHINGGSLGPGWKHPFEQRIYPSDDRVILQSGQGDSLVFVDVGGNVYAGPAGIAQSLLKRPGGGWALVARDQSATLFDAEGYLIGKQDPSGNMLQFTYEEYNWLGLNGVYRTGKRLARVDAPGGRHLWFGYDYYHPDRLIVVGDNASRTVRYGYDAIGRLSSVTDPTGGESTYTYSENAWLLVSKTDPNGEVVFTNTYDERARVIHQVNNQGQDLTFVYDLVPDTEGLTSGSGAAPYLLVTTVTDQIGAEVVYTYGADGLLRRMTDPAGATTEYRNYTASRRPGEVEDALGRVTRYTYDDRGLPTEVTNAFNQTTELAYDDWGRPTVITDTLGRAYTFSYDGSRLTAMTDPLGQSMVMTYTVQAGWQGVLSAVTNQGGGVTTFTYDVSGDVTAITDALNQVSELHYDAVGRPVQLVNARGYTTTLTYDAADRVTAMTDALSGTVRMDYDDGGRPIRVTDQLSNTTLITYTLGLPQRPAAVQDARGGMMTIGYGPLGRPVTMTNQLGHTTVITYDLAGRPIATTDPLGHTTRYGYDLLGNTTVITDANGHAVTVQYDALNRLSEVRNAKGQFLQYGYDAAGNVAVITDTLGYTATVTYDALNRPLIATDPEGRATRYAYTPLGLTSVVTDGNGIATQYLYDALGQLEQVVANARPDLPDGVDVNVRTQFAYDLVGNLRQVTDPRNMVTTMAYDALNRLASVTDPLSRTMQYAYDARGLLERWTKADGTPVTYAYDARGLLETLTAPDQQTDYTYDAAGRLTTMQDASGTTAFTYDNASRPLTVTLSLGGTVGYRYDAAGNRTRLIYPDGRAAAYAYDEANQLRSITDWGTGVTTYDYDGNGRVLTATLPSGVTTTYTYDRSGKPVAIQHANDSGPLADYQYIYDDTGRRIGAIEAGRTITYTYDGIYRLLEAQDSAGEIYAYTYDAAGNRLSKLEPGESVTATYDAANQLLTLNGLPVQYDANGNLVDDGERTYAYDDLDRLIRATRGISETTFGYNGNGDRAWQATDGVTTTFTLDLNTALTQVLAEQGGGNTTYLLPGVGQQANGVWQYQHADALGNVRLLTDSTGQVLSTMHYSPFGELDSQSGPRSLLGFTGEPSDPSGDLVYLRARFYHPALGRFLTPDSLIPDVTNGQAWNAYAYVYNDPLNLVDPSGHFGEGIGEWLTTAGEGLSEWAQTVQRGAQRVSVWWNNSPCECNASQEPTTSPWLATPDGMTVLNLSAQGAWGLASAPIDMQRTTTLQWQHPVTGKWYTTFKVTKELKDAKDRLAILLTPFHQTIGIDTRPGDYIGRRVQIDTRIFNRNLGLGLRGTIGIGVAIDLLFQFLSDWHSDPCRPPKEFAGRLLMSGLYGLGTAAIGVGAVMIAAFLGLPALAAGFIGFAIAAIAGWAFTPLKNAMLNLVTDRRRRQ